VPWRDYCPLGHVLGSGCVQPVNSAAAPARRQSIVEAQPRKRHTAATAQYAPECRAAALLSPVPRHGVPPPVGSTRTGCRRPPRISSLPLCRCSSCAYHGLPILFGRVIQPTRMIWSSRSRTSTNKAAGFMTPSRRALRGNTRRGKPPAPGRCGKVSRLQSVRAGPARRGGRHPCRLSGRGR